MHFATRALAFIATLGQVLALSTPPNGALVVGKGAKYSKIQLAVNALSKSSKSEQTIFIEAGTYSEQVLIPELQGPLVVYGSAPASGSYSDNTVTIQAHESQKTKPNNDETATLRVHTQAGFKMYNVNVVNTFGKGSQALALSALAANQGYYACQFIGYQDTVLANRGAQLYAKCYIEGAIDFIFGQQGKVWFDGCDIRVSAAVGGSITANGRSSNDDTQFVIHKSTVAGKPGANLSKASAFLGRPWRPYAMVTFQSTSMTDIIDPRGFAVWQASSPQTEHVNFGEFQNNGAGTKGPRASFAKQRSAAIKIEQVLGNNYASAGFVDKKYLS